MFYRFGSKRGILLTDELMECKYLIPREGWWIFFVSFPCALPSTEHCQHSGDASVNLHTARRQGKGPAGAPEPRVRPASPWKRGGSRDSGVQGEGNKAKTRTNFLSRLPLLKKTKQNILFILNDLHCRCLLKFLIFNEFIIFPDSVV